MKIYVKAAPDPNTNSGYKDMYMNRINSVISRLRLNDLDWDVKGNKFTLRLEDKVITITYSNRKAQIQKVGSNSLNKVDITTNGNSDISKIVKAIKSA